MLEKLVEAESFERFLHTKYVGHKRFSLEGGEALIPLLDRILNDAALRGLREVVLGMPHRGRLNVLANTIGKPLVQIFAEFEGNDPSSYQGSGDVKYHLGASGTHVADTGETIGVTLAPNPSHLEFVNPVVEGMVRAKQDALGDRDHGRVLPVLMHGDAAFAGQGVVAETLNLSGLHGYRTGGTIHVVVNNQIGFTTLPEDARSSTYATDVAKMVHAPVFHVNGDDPEAVALRGRARARVPAEVPQGRGDRPRLLPALGPQRDRRAELHAAADVRQDQDAPVGRPRSTARSWCARRVVARERARPAVGGRRRPRCRPRARRRRRPSTRSRAASRRPPQPVDAAGHARPAARGR